MASKQEEERPRAGFSEEGSRECSGERERREAEGDERLLKNVNIILFCFLPYVKCVKSMYCHCNYRTYFTNAPFVVFMCADIYIYIYIHSFV